MFPHLNRINFGPLLLQRLSFDRLRQVAAIFSITAICSSAIAQTPDFADLSLEQLVHYDVSTLGRKNATVFDTPAPAQVVSGDEIHNSGATSIPEALRLVAGVQVSRIDAVNYAISVRGFNDATSSKVLLLEDGRSVYNQLSSGTDWGLLDLVMEDINRIEVQRGPAGTLWGANAVNGVINIVTKNAHSTLGSLVSVSEGSELDTAITVRQGFSLSPASAMRVYAKYQENNNYNDATSGVTAWNSRLVGSRFDWDRPGGGGLSIIGEYRELRTDNLSSVPQLTPPYSFVEGEEHNASTDSLTLRWSQPIPTDGQLSILGAVEHGDTEQYFGSERHTTADLDAQVTLHPLARNEVIAGATYRSTSDHIGNTPYLTYDKTEATTYFAGAFLQDEITLVPDRVSLTAGSKFERNSFSGWEIQPSARLLWHPTKDQTVWAAVSRAARTPSRAERDVHFYAAVLPPSEVYPLPIVLIANGAPNFSSEHVNSFEVGHRFQRGNTFSVDTSIFYSSYPDLRGLRPELLPFDYTSVPPHLVLNLNATNSLAGHTSGGELAVHWRPLGQLEFNASISAITTVLHEISPGSYPDPSVPGLMGNTPREEYKFHATWRPADRWTVDVMARHTGKLIESEVPAYDGLDLRFSWMIRPDLELELVGRDLLKPVHTEIPAAFIGSGALPISRSVYLRVTYRH